MYPCSATVEVAVSCTRNGHLSPLLVLYISLSTARLRFCSITSCVFSVLSPFFLRSFSSLYRFSSSYQFPNCVFPLLPPQSQSHCVCSLSLSEPHLLPTMGANLSLLTPHAHTVAVRSYIDVLTPYKFLDVINDNRFLKTIKAVDTRSGTLLVIKVFIKPQQTNVQLRDVSENLAREALLLASYPNILAWHQITETDLAGYLVRQLLRTNLYDRLSLRPFLAPVEKMWLVYQMLRLVELLHLLDICHGDIKTENVLVSSSNWLVLTDFAQHIKPVSLPDDNPSEFVFYFDSSDRRSCYVAPERFYNKSAPNREQGAKLHLTPEMDLFSLGCVIAELYMDGEPTFSLLDLYRYKRGDMDPALPIADPNIRKMVRRLLSVDPDTRPQALELLEEYRDVCFPLYFYDFLYDFVYQMNSSERFAQDDDNVSPSDWRIDAIYDAFSDIVSAFNYSYERPNNISDGFPSLKVDLPPIPSDYEFKSSSAWKNTESHGEIILLDLVFSLLKSTRRPRSKVRACELILALLERTSDDIKLDRCLPHLCSLIDDFIEDASIFQGNSFSDSTNFANHAGFSTLVAHTALLALTTLLRSCNTITPMNALVFPEYLAPKLKSIAFLNCPFPEEASYIKSTLAMCLPYLAKISDHFCVLCHEFKTESQSVGSLETAKSRSEADFKDLSEALLTEANVNVRISLINNILPLCQYFGVDKTNDIILPHLITYLNDSNYHLRLAFLSSIMDIGNFIGALAFEQYLLPLLFQTLGDTESSVVLKVLEVFNFFVSKKLINPESEFNVLSVYKELLSNTIILLLQPNEWIRQSVVFLILLISNNLLNADRFCFLYPLIKRYLSYDISVLSWDTLYPCLTSPLTKQVYEAAQTWRTNATGKSMFWQMSNYSAFHANGKQRLVSFSKDMGKYVYVPQRSYNSLADAEQAPADIPLSHEDRQWILKLKAVGMDDGSLWKVFALKDHFLSLGRFSVNAPNADSTEFELAGNINVPPTNIFFEVCYKSEPISQSTKVTESSYEHTGNDALSVRLLNTSSSFALPSAGKSKASLQMVEANVMGEMDLSHESQQLRHPTHIHLTKNEPNVAHRVFSVNNEKIISVTMRHNFGGTNPFVQKYLKTLGFVPTLDDFPEFGLALKANRDSFHGPMKIQGNVVAQINANSAGAGLDAITKVVVSPLSEFLVTGSEMGRLKIWDCNKLDKNITGKGAALSMDLKLAVLDIVFMPYRHVIAISTMDGNIRFLRVHVSRGKHRRIVKYSKLSLVRSVKLEDDFAINLEVVSTPNKTICVGITAGCKIVGYDVVTMEKCTSLQSPLHFGIPSTFIVDHNFGWLLLGTSDGILCLWDLRFKILVRSWNVILDLIKQQKNPIQKLVTVNSSLEATSFAMIGGSDEADITVWRMPGFTCRNVYSVNESTPKIKPYELKEVDKVEQASIEKVLADLSVDTENRATAANRALVFVPRGGSGGSSGGQYVTATGDNRIVIWDSKTVTDSVLLLTPGPVSFTENCISLSLSVAYEKIESSKSENTKGVKNGHDAILDVAVVAGANYMVVAVERNGLIYAYK